MLRHINRSGTPDWIDVCLYNPYQVTIRSFTNDLDFIPRVAGYSYDEDIGFEIGEDILLMSNEMPKLSHQALKFFSSELDNDFRMVDVGVDVGILNALATANVTKDNVPVKKEVDVVELVMDDDDKKGIC